MKISVIIPVYNVKEYLEKCVDSVLNQTFSDLEILLINDGSTDGSNIICDEFEKKDSRIKVYHKENGGLSDARNFGLLKSTGDYIVFLDSDDFIKEDAYEKFMEEICMDKSLEIVVGNVLDYFSDGTAFYKTKEKFSHKNNVTGTEFMVQSIKNKSYSSVSVQGIYKKSFLINNKLFFKKGILHEDELWMPKVLISAKNVKYTDNDFYMHLQREGSITHREDKKDNALDLIKISYDLEQLYSQISNKKYKRELTNRAVSLYINAYITGKLYDDSKFKVDYKFLLKNVNTLKNLLKILAVKMNSRLFINMYLKKT